MNTDKEAIKLAIKIMKKDTCYGIYDARPPSDDELSEYFGMWIEDYAKEYHKKQTIIDADNKIKEEEMKKQWWNEL